MITLSNFTSRKQTLINSGVDERIAGIKAVLEYGTEEGNITEDEAETALSTLQSFLSSHPDHIFLSPRERYKHGVEESTEEVDLWTTIQQILDKAQPQMKPGVAKNKIKK